MRKLELLQLITFFISFVASCIILIAGLLCLREGYYKIAAIDLGMIVMNVFISYSAFKKLTVE